MFVKKVNHFLLVINQVVILNNIVSMGVRVAKAPLRQRQGGLWATPFYRKINERKYHNI